MADENTLTDQEQAQQIWAEMDNEENGQPDTPADPYEPSPKSAEPDPAPKDEAKKEAPATAPSSGLSEEDRALLKQIPNIVQALRTTSGNVGELKNQLLQLGKRAAQTTQGDAPTEKQIAKAAETPESWKKMKDAFPDWAEAIEAYHAANRPEVPNIDSLVQERLTKANESFEQRLAQREQTWAAQVVEAFRPGSMATLQAPEFKQWFANQPDSYRQKHDTFNPADVLPALKDYDSFVSGNTTTTAQPADSKAQRLANAVMPGGSSPPLKKSESEMTPEELWALEDEADRRAAAQRQAY